MANLPEPGDVMEDGTICGGISSKTQRPFFLLSGIHVQKNFYETEGFIARLNRETDYSDWRLPTHAELNRMLHDHKKGALAKEFGDAARYWTSAPSREDTLWTLGLPDLIARAREAKDRDVMACFVRSP